MMAATTAAVRIADPSYVMDAERGAVAPVPGSPGRWWVRGTETVYLVDTGKPGELTRGTCECRGHGFRGTCAHIDAVAAFCSEMRRDRRLSEWVQRHWFGQVAFPAPPAARRPDPVMDRIAHLSNDDLLEVFA